MSWRYQPVFTIDEAGAAFTLVEAHFDDAGNLTSWTEADATPMGENVVALSEDLNRMIVDALCWEPVLRSELRPGMKFKQRVSMETRREIADFVQANADAMKRQPKPQAN